MALLGTALGLSPYEKVGATLLERHTAELFLFLGLLILNSTASPRFEGFYGIDFSGAAMTKWSTQNSGRLLQRWVLP